MRSGAFVVCVLSMGSAMPGFAQSRNNIPSGSPVDPYQRSSSNDSAGEGGDARPSLTENPFTGQQLLRPYTLNASSPTAIATDQLLRARGGDDASGVLIRQPPAPGEFEQYMERILGRKLPRFGAQLILPSERDFAAPATATVPPDYIVQPGDTILISLAGSMDGSVERQVDNNGRIFLTGVGPVMVAGVRHADLRDTISRAVGQQFRNFTVSVDIKQLRGIRVYVTGLANNPGAFTVNSLSTLANAVFQAGGPASGGSWRTIKLYRNGQQIADFDLYQLMRGGHRVNDVQLQNEDVLFIPPAGEQVAVIGSVNEEAIFEALPGESVADMLAAAGGPNTLADRSRVILYRTAGEEIPGPKEIDFAQAGSRTIKGGDIIQMLSTGTLSMPIDRQSVLVRVEGEVNRPGIYYVSPGTPASEIISRAGGLTTRAYPFGTRFTRQSVKIQQQDSFREALRQLELSLAAAPLTANSSISEAERASQLAGARAVLDRLREAEPDGRVVLQLTPNATSISGNILMENNDAIYVPPAPTTVGVFGAVYRPASFLVTDGGNALRVKDYIERAGGTLRAADRGSVIVVRANGEVLSRKRGALNARVLPGDVVFVPVRTQGNSFWSKFKDITQTLFQIGLSAATVVAVTK